jgi:hypothetical protein
LADGSFVAEYGRARERGEGECEAEESKESVYVRVDGSSVVDRHVAVRRHTAGSRQGCSNAKRRRGQSHDELLELHVVSEWRCVVSSVVKGKE